MLLFYCSSISNRIRSSARGVYCSSNMYISFLSELGLFLLWPGLPRVINVTLRREIFVVPPTCVVPKPLRVSVVAPYYSSSVGWRLPCGGLFLFHPSFLSLPCRPSILHLLADNTQR